MKKILIVDDNPQDLSLLQTLLNKHGYRVTAAANGAEALEKARSERPDMIISDILMPIMDGFTLCREWKRDGPLKDVPFLFFTATYKDPKDEKFALGLGAERFIIKPQKQEKLLGIIEEVLSDRKAGRLVPSLEPPRDTSVRLKEYNEVLIRKLEDKMVQIEEANRRLELEVAKRRRAEEATHSSEERQRAILQTAMDGYWMTDMRGRLLEVNESYCRISGYSAQELSAMCISDLEADESASSTAARIKKIMAQGEDRFESRHRRKDGSIFDVEVSIQYRPVEGGRCSAFLRDITERNRSERALKESEEKFRLIFEDSKDGIIQVDVESRKFHAANKTFCDMVQYTLDEIRQLGIMDIHPDEDVPWIIEEFDRRARQETEKILDIPVRRKDGSIFWADIKSSPVTISGKKYVLGNFRDVTERRKAEEKLARLGMAVDQATEVVIITDREGRIQYTNPAFERISGYTSEEVVGKNPETLLGEKQDMPVYQELLGTLSRGTVWAGHLINRRKDGSIYEEDATISPVRDSSGNIVSFVAVMRDVTQLLSLEKQVRTAQKMEAVGTLAGGVAHDFNNVLTVILGFGEMLKLRIANDPKALSDLDQILRSAERASVLTRQLLTFARRQIITLVNLDLNLVVTDLDKLLRKITRADIGIRTTLAESVPTIRADQGQVEQVLMNLAINARDAMPGGGQLVIATNEEWVDEEYVKQFPYMKAGRYAVLSVSDTGIGMDEETRERIFEPFFTTKGPDQGTGLGLAIVYGIVKQHNGFIHVYSEPGKGTTFRIYLPAADAPADAKVFAPQGLSPGGNETILLAEDNESVRQLAEQTLVAYGYRVQIACDGEEAVDIFRRHGKEIAIVVLDMVMPKKGGKDAYDEMVAMNPGIRAIFMSGYSADAIHDSFVLHSGIPFLQKPFGPGALARKVREVLDGA